MKKKNAVPRGKMCRPASRAAKSGANYPDLSRQLCVLYNSHLRNLLRRVRGLERELKILQRAPRFRRREPRLSKPRLLGRELRLLEREPQFLKRGAAISRLCSHAQHL